MSRQATVFSAPASLAAARHLAWLRVLVLGSAGAGKTTFAVRLAELLDLPLIHLDFEYWRPGWQPTPPEEWPIRVDELIAGEAWVMDGNYGGTMERRLARADAAVFLDVHRVRCLWRVVVRSLRYWRRSRPDLPPGCPERFDWGFFAWVWTYGRRSRGRAIELLAGSGLPVVHLRSKREADRWLTT
ncbi:MAG TPA: AAA family ATPase [Candidatus Dormibacteraeota bacterium]|nr:AAA family ATPase [Candidatus Dormibacteraeota bacterium]